jgi:dTDP-4-dehydrorhamnose reductase
MRFFITGTAGFIGFHLARLLLAEGHTVHGYDGMTPYYDVRLKQRRHAMLREFPAFVATESMLEDLPTLQAAVQAAQPDVIVHLAAQAGVRYSLENPAAYIDANLVGTFHLLQAAVQARPRHLLLASTSSVYGANTHMPFAEGDKADTPLTLYAATKKANEAMSHAYSHIHGVPTTVFRFFTVYGPWGRPDMALFKFTKGILDGTRSKFTTTATCSATSPTSTIWCAPSACSSTPSHPRRTPARPRTAGSPSRATRSAPRRLGASSTSATASPCGCSISSMRSRPKSAAPPSATTCPCSGATCPLLGPTPAYCSA